MSYIKYGEKELNHLKKADEKLKKVILEFGYIKRKTNINLFNALIGSIISQQISTKAAITVKNNLKTLIKEINPKNILSFTAEQLKSCGLSFRKVDYLKNIARSFNDGAIDFNNLKNLSDEEITKELIKLKGVGPWTVEMLLIHTFLRPDVMSYLDLGLKNGLKILHGLEKIEESYFNYYKNIYSPYGTVASIYLWEVYRRHNKN